MTFTALPTLTLVLPNRDDLIARLDFAHGRPSLFVSGVHALRAGQKAALHLTLVHEQEAVQLRVDVGWVRHRPHPRLPMGTALLLDDTCSKTIDLLARGETHLQARRRRYQVVHPAALSWSGMFYGTTLLDISRTGCFMTLAQPLPVGALVAVHLHDREWCDHLTLPAKVVRWDSVRGGAGLRFISMQKEFAVQALIGHLNALVALSLDSHPAHPQPTPAMPASLAGLDRQPTPKVQSLRGAPHA